MSDMSQQLLADPVTLGAQYQLGKSFLSIIYWQNVQSIKHKVRVVSDENGSTTINIYTLKFIDGVSLKLDDRTFPELG